MKSSRYIVLKRLQAKRKSSCIETGVEMLARMIETHDKTAAVTQQWAHHLRQLSY